MLFGPPTRYSIAALQRLVAPAPTASGDGRRPLVPAPSGRQTDVYHREQNDGTGTRSRRVRHSAGNDKDVTGVERIVRVYGVKGHLALEHVHRERLICAVLGKVSTRIQLHDGEPERALLHERSRAASAFGNERWIDRERVLREMLDEYVSSDRAMQG